MKGVILAGGQGTRLRPLTHITSKQLLPVYNKPLIWFPLRTLMQAGIDDILIISSPQHSGQFVDWLGSGRELDITLRYEVQDEPAGLAHGLLLAENFARGDSVAMILGDNIYEDDFSQEIQDFKDGAKIFAKQVDDPRRFGVVEFDDQMNCISIEEKPENPKSNFAQTGLYVYDETVFDRIKTLKPSHRGELEITDLNNVYLKDGALRVGIVEGEWIDAGTFDSLLRASNFVAGKFQRGEWTE